MDLEEKLCAILDAFPASSALYCVDLTTETPIAAIRENTRVVSASTIKVPLLCCALQAVCDGFLSLEQEYPISPTDFCNDTEVFEPGYRQDGCTLWELLYWMTVSSDNTATNTVISLLGFDRINRYFSSLELTQTALNRKMLDFSAIREGRNNFTSPVDQYRIYSLLFHGTILNPTLRDVAFDFLRRSRSFDSLLRYIPDPVPVLHKPGALDHLNHDAGLFFLENRPYFLGIYTWDGPALDGEPQQMRLIGQLSRIVYDFMKRGKAQ